MLHGRQMANVTYIITPSYYNGDSMLFKSGSVVLFIYLYKQFDIIECLTDGDTVLGIGQFEQFHEICVPNHCEELVVFEGHVLCGVDVVRVGCLELV